MSKNTASTHTIAENCPLCTTTGGRLVWQNANWRVVHADGTGDTDFPAFYRLVSQAHYAEWTDMPPERQQEGMRILAVLERCMRIHIRPFKMNLAALGNVVPHIHWHVIGRFEWDSHFPAPIWAAAQRPVHTDKNAAILALLPAFEAALKEALGQTGNAE